jgi:DNA-directed RNA polymerase alpha subunit
MSKEITHAQFRAAIELIHQYEKQIAAQRKEVKTEMAKVSPFALVCRDTPIYDVPFSTRCLNILRAYQSDWGFDYSKSTMELFEQISVRMLLKCQNFGKKSLTEIETACKYSGVKLGRKV